MTPKYNGRSREFTVEEIKFVGEEVIKGKKIKDLAKIFKVGNRSILKIINHYNTQIAPRPEYELRGFVQKTLGNKTIPYYQTEAEMLKTPKYSWNSLSKIEKHFYLNYGKKEEGHSPND